MNFFGLKKKKNRRHTPTKNCQEYFSFRTEKRCFRYPPLVPVMLFIRRSKTDFVMLFLLCECKFESLDGQHL